MTDIQQLNDRLGIRGVAEVITDRGGLPAVWVEGRHAAAGTVYLHGGHVAAWRPHGFDDVLWLSNASAWQPGKPIRGGVPVCFPWFGPNKNDPKAPAHGFARLTPWTLEAITHDPRGVTVSLATRSDDASRAAWPHDFLLRHRVTFGQTLRMALELTNTGNTPFTAEEAQHTYFSLGDVRQARVTGLAGVRYVDKVDGQKEKVQEGDITITGETDRVYLDTTAPTAIEDPSRRRRITVRKEGSRATVVWNPWVAKAKAMPDFGDDEWPGMICVETCNVGPFAVTLAPGQTHTMVAEISVEAI
jgi:glucose-6-phosphate 1-epimerase